MSLHAVEEQAMGARIIPFLEKVTETFSSLVIDPPTQAAAIIDPVLDYDPAAGRIRTHSADAIAKMVQAAWLRVEWILETRVHADHLSAAGLLKEKARRRARHWFECPAGATDSGQFVQRQSRIPARRRFRPSVRGRRDFSHRRPRRESALYTGAYAGRHELHA